MATVSEILKNARIRQNLTLSQVEQATKIRSYFLASLEKGDYQSLPSPAYARGFIKNYGEFLGLATQPLLARLRRELNEKTGSVLPKRMDLDDEFPFKIRFTGVFLLVLLIATLIFSYFFFQYKGFWGSPTLTVDVPSNNEVVKGSLVTVSGKTTPETAVKVNGEFVEVGKDGSFQKTLHLFKGTFAITVVATNRFGKQTEVTRTITVE